MSPVDDARAVAASLLLRISRELRDPQEERWLALDISMAQFKVLFILFHHGPSTVGALAQVLNVKLPTVSATLERLVKSGYVQREESPDDRRLVINRLTAEGTLLVNQLRAERRLRVDQALGRLNEGDVQALTTSLQTLARAMGIARAPSDSTTGTRETTPRTALPVAR